MITYRPRRVSRQHITTTSAALAAALLPLAAAVLLAKAMAGDPLAPVNTLITSGGQRVRISPSVWRGSTRTALSQWKSQTLGRTRCKRTAPHQSPRRNS
ncbi:hypothetical protein [Streptomyces sp. NRRL S-118]|uniref:hypothetical protein n=1 Tax=Streptomyces sp. NRRL S-118 TaxID=1463881 RepID=UPI0018FED1DC|nr:hypothetical protein [Streptomyces sp. NRRL S-118]